PAPDTPPPSLHDALPISRPCSAHHWTPTLAAIAAALPPRGGAIRALGRPCGARLRVGAQPASPVRSIAATSATASEDSGLTCNTDRKSTRLNSSHQIISY